jgi:EAL domain-containing protein (putative c-di-GMP-specific phosphodiesterase class I)
MLKIDRAFLQHCDRDGKTARVVAAIAAVARELGLEVVAEGIEQPEQEPCLQALGCRLGQGFGFSRPVAADAFGDLLAQDPSAS